ncbi:MAG: hypothetical protein AAF420_09590 [Pseudomonadota bacterium]
MKQISFYALFALAVSTVQADTPPDNALAPSANELTQLIAGNSTYGNWAGQSYKQYFDSNGTTRYDEEGRRPSSGTWRIKANGQYCSIWPPSTNETCYNLVVTGEDIYWQSGDTYYKATVVPGNIFNP